MLFKDRKKCKTNIRPLYELFEARNKQIAMEFRGRSIVDWAAGGVRQGLGVDREKTEWEDSEPDQEQVFWSPQTFGG